MFGNNAVNGGTNIDQTIAQLDQLTQQNLQTQLENGLKTAQTQRDTGLLSAALQSLQAVSQNIR